MDTSTLIRTFTWLLVEKNSLQETYIAEVPGGWLFKVVHKGDACTVAIQFVPFDGSH